MIKHFFTKQFLHFLMAGGLAALLHWLARILLSQWLPFGWAVTIAYGVGMLVAFVLNSLLVFPDSEKPRHIQARDFTIINLCFFPLVWSAALVLDVLLKKVGITRYTEASAHGIAVMLPTCATFLIYKFFAFRGNKYGRT